MTTLAAAGLQDAGGALAPSRKASRDDLLGVSAFDAALSQSAEDSSSPMTEAGAEASATSGSDGDGVAKNPLQALDVQDFAKTSPRAAAGRLVSRMAVAWLDATAASALAIPYDQSGSAMPASDAKTPALSIAGVSSPQDLSPQDLSPQDLSPQDLAGAAGPESDPARTPQAPAHAAAAAPPAPARDASISLSGAAPCKNAGPSFTAPRPQARLFDPASGPDAAPAKATAEPDKDSTDVSAPQPSAADASATAISTPVQALDPALLASQQAFTPPQVAQAIITPVPQAVAASAPAATSADDSVARIGAAISSPARPRTEATPLEQEPETTSVHVVSLQSWLPPVDPKFSGGGQSHAFPGKNPGAAPGEDGSGKEGPGEKGQGAEPLPSFPAASANLAPPSSSSSPQAGGVKASDSSAATQFRDLPSAPTPTLRRDLEITLTPQDLGGLQVKLKSSGDRLELAFVADRGETARMISDKSVALENQLHDAGIGLGGVAITTSAAGDTTGDAPQGGGQGGQAGQGLSGQASGSSSGAAGGQGDSESTRHRQDFSGRQSQDSKNEPSDVSRDSRGSAGDRGLYL